MRSLEELEDENKRLAKQLTSDHKGYMESRKSLCDYMDRLEAENKKLKDQIEGIITGDI